MCQPQSKVTGRLPLNQVRFSLASPRLLLFTAHASGVLAGSV
jgi:hypothetical protein